MRSFVLRACDRAAHEGCSGIIGGKFTGVFSNQWQRCVFSPGENADNSLSYVRPREWARLFKREASESTAAGKRKGATEAAKFSCASSFSAIRITDSAATVENSR